MVHTDFLVIGSGLAALSYAIKTAEHFTDKEVLILTKSNLEESNTKYAQGGVAVVQDFENDSFEKHIQDTLIAGGNKCDQEVVSKVIKEGPKLLDDLMAWGVNFDREPSGNLSLTREGGHSEKRVVHHKDITGLEISNVLIRKVKQLSNIKIWTNTFVKELLVTDNACKGCIVVQGDELQNVLADQTVLATGGIGSIYGASTNPSIATGDGIAMAIRANARVEDMAFVQFHPSAFYIADEERYFLLTEALRGQGAFLKNEKGERFLLAKDSRAELAPRDIVARAIFEEIHFKQHQVYIDATHFDTALLRSHFPNIYEVCKRNGYDMQTDRIPITPVSHYICGGIAVDLYGRTSVDNLFACGECARTGLHGANRLASNSLLEALVYANEVFEYQKKHQPVVSVSNKELPSEVKLSPSEKSCDKMIQLKKALNDLMIHKVGIVRSYSKLEEAFRGTQMLIEEVAKLKPSIEKFELRNMLVVAQQIIFDSQSQKSNQGGYYNIDLL